MKNIPSSRKNSVRRFKLATGVPPIEYLQNVRVESAQKQLEHSSRNINEIIEQSGYSDPKSFRKTFVKIVGMPPLEYRKEFRVA
jgi:transcriptional regulator GlxA family with amidase domain